MTTEYIVNAIALFLTAWLITKIPCCQNISASLSISKALAKKHVASGIPQHEVESIASCLLPAIQRFYESDEGRREFAEWKAEQDKMKTEIEPPKLIRKAG